MIMVRTFMLAAVVSFLTMVPEGQSLARDNVEVRFGDHKGYSRAVLDWPRKVGYRIEERDGEVWVHFDRAAKYDLSNFRVRGPRAIAGVDAATNGLSVRLVAPSGSAMKDFRLGNRVVVDVAGSTQPKAAEDTRKNTRAAKSATAKAGKKKPANTSKAKPEANVADASTDESGGSAALPDTVGGRTVIPVTVERRPGRAIFRFTWPEPTPAAALHRGEHIWLAFGSAGHPDADRNTEGRPWSGLGLVS